MSNWYQKILVSLCTILLIILLYYQFKPKPETNYKRDFETIQERIDSVYKNLKEEKEKTDAFTIVREYYRESKEIQKEEIQKLPLDSAVKLLRKNIINYEEDTNSHVSLDYSTK